MAQALLGVSTSNHFGVAKESERETGGMVLPFIYITYILRRPEEPEGGEDVVLDVIFK